MSYKIEQNTFTHTLVHSFLSRIGFLLNKIHQEQINEYECPEFKWSLDVLDDANSRTDCLLIVSKFDVTFKWNGAKVKDDAHIFVNDRKLQNVAESDNLKYFTEIEQYIIQHIIAKEKELVDSTEYKFPNFQSR